MALSRPLMEEEHLLLGVGGDLDINRAAGGVYVVGRPAHDGLPEFIRIAQDDEGNLPIYYSSDEEGEVEIAVVGGGRVEFGVMGEGEGELLPRIFSDEEEGDEEDVGPGWGSEDSGYSSMFEDEYDEEAEEEEVDEEEEEEEEEDEDGIRPRSPLTQWFPPLSFWQELRRVLTPPPFPAGHPLSLPFGVECPEEAPPPVPQRSEESTKRSREEDHTEQVSVKRQRNGEDDHEDSAPSTSGLGSSTKRTREEDYRWSPPNSSGLISPTVRRYWQWNEDSDSD